MRCTILQPGYLPWLGFFNQMALSDCFVFFDDVQFDRRGWRNRNRIKSPNGPVWLTVPVIQKGKFEQSLRDTQISYSEKWVKKHLRSLEFGYRKAPYFASYFSGIEQILTRQIPLLVDLDLELIKLHMDWFGLTHVKTYRSSEMGIQEMDKTGRLVEICQKLNVTEYISGPLCQNYLELEQFARAGIEVMLHSYKHPEYPQLYGDFTPYMAALDLLFNTGESALSTMKQTDSLIPFSEYESGN